MNTLSKHKAGLALGLVIGLWHVAWTCLVSVGYAQTLINWVFRLHMIRPVYVVAPFDVGSAVWLVILTSLTGYALGWLFAAIWNGVQTPLQVAHPARTLDKAA